MPDWVSHLMIGLIIAEIFNIEKKSLLVLGALLPDLLMKFVTFSYPLSLDHDLIFWTLYPLHSPIGNFLLTLLIIQFFDYDSKKSWFLITIGWVSHLFSDLFNKHILLGQSSLLFPFSWKNIEIGLLWPEQFYYMMVPLMIIYIYVLIVKYFLRTRNLKSKHI